MDYFSDVIGYWLRRAHMANSKIFAQVFASSNLTMLQFGALILIGEKSGISQKELAKKIGAEPSVIVKPLEYIEGRGLIERRRAAPDRRVQSLNITDLGQEMIDAGKIASEKIHAVVMRDIDPELEKEIIKGLRNIVRNVEDYTS